MHYIQPDLISLETIDQIMRQRLPIALSDDAVRRITHCREYLDHKIGANDELFYGINTGFGSLCDVRIPEEEIGQLQHNLVMSHAAGAGDLVPEEIVRIMLLLKIQSLSQGFSAVRVKVVERLTDFFNAGIIPVIFELGSLGASGDLAPLAHLSLPLVGLGEVWF
ncbi:MAG TPA: aromatic amino acid lyase, partial [Saprospiraceae bacterium]|nr:aromatic amino acid lyase [Saprospiraceae bacterium]